MRSWQLISIIDGSHSLSGPVINCPSPTGLVGPSQSSQEQGKTTLPLALSNNSWEKQKTEKQGLGCLHKMGISNSRMKNVLKAKPPYLEKPEVSTLMIIRPHTTNRILKDTQILVDYFIIFIFFSNSLVSPGRLQTCHTLVPWEPSDLKQQDCCAMASQGTVPYISSDLNTSSNSIHKSMISLDPHTRQLSRDKVIES